MSFIFGSLVDDQEIRKDCAKAISYLVIKRHVYKDVDILENCEDKGQVEEQLISIFREDVVNVLDAIMYHTASDVGIIRATAFSTLSHLSSYSSLNKGVLCQVQRDIDIFSEDPKINIDAISKAAREQSGEGS